MGIIFDGNKVLEELMKAFARQSLSILKKTHTHTLNPSLILSTCKHSDNFYFIYRSKKRIKTFTENWYQMNP